MMRLKLMLVTRRRHGRRQATITGKLALAGRGRIARWMRRLSELSPIRRVPRLRWLG